MNEYKSENNETVDIKRLESPPMPKEDYAPAHKGMVIACHDIIIEYQGGALLVRRENHPAKGTLWSVGGRIKRGLTIDDSLKKTVKEECGLDIKNIEGLGVARTFFATDPFGHGKGTDTLNLLFFAQGSGTLHLDSRHSAPTIIRPDEYDEKFKAGLHPYVRDLLEKALPLIRK